MFRIAGLYTAFVILTGANEDGAEGLRRVKRRISRSAAAPVKVGSMGGSRMGLLLNCNRSGKPNGFGSARGSRWFVRWR